MIIKPYVPRASSDARLKAGVAAEKQMAHYLDRHFRESKKLFVLHDIKLEFEGENAQIDHLVVHPFGVAIVESKSVSTSVRLTDMDEWERRIGRSWSGMPSPLLQAERQGKLLKSLLKTREADLLDKVLGLAQGTFSLMAVDVFAAVSDSGTIQRARKDQAPNALKADAIPAAIEAAVAGYRRATSLLTLDIKAIVKAPRDFKEAECVRIARFLEATDRRCREVAPTLEAASLSGSPFSASAVGRAGRGTRGSPIPPRTPDSSVVERAVCASCQSPRVVAKIKYSPYLKCLDCGKNTAVKVECASCRTAVYMERDGTGFAGTCEGCAKRHVVEVRG